MCIYSCILGHTHEHCILVHTRAYIEHIHAYTPAHLWIHTSIQTAGCWNLAVTYNLAGTYTAQRQTAGHLAVTNLFSVPCVSTDTREVRDACIHTTNYTNTPRCNRLELHLIGERVNGGVCQGHDALGPCRVQGLGFRFGLGSGGWGRRGCKTLFRLRRVQEFRLRRTPVVQGHVAQGHTRLILMRTRRWTHA